MHTLDVLTIGGGPAGLLCRRLAEIHGLDALTLEARPEAASPQSAHVHFFPAGCMESIESWVPGFAQALRLEGCPAVDEQGRRSFRADARLLPSRSQFDRALQASCASPGRVYSGKATTYEHNGDIWRVACADGTILQSRWLIDASGQSRRTLRAIAPMLQALPVLHEGPAASHYLSARVRGPAFPAERMLLRSPGSNGSPGLLGLRIDDETWQITLQLPAGSERSNWQDAVGLLDARASHIFADHQCLSLPRAYGGQRSSCLEIDAGSAPDGWLAIGDALLCTPPYQGNGIGNLISQLKLLDRGLRNRDDLRTIQAALFGHASSSWLQATLLDSLRGGCFRPGRDPCSLPGHHSTAGTERRPPHAKRRRPT